MKLYTVYSEDFGTQIIYVGVDEKLAFECTPEDDEDYLYMEVWENNQRKEKYTKYRNDKWELDTF